MSSFLPQCRLDELLISKASHVILKAKLFPPLSLSTFCCNHGTLYTALCTNSNSVSFIVSRKYFCRLKEHSYNGISTRNWRFTFLIYELMYKLITALHLFILNYCNTKFIGSPELFTHTGAYFAKRNIYFLYFLDGVVFVFYNLYAFIRMATCEGRLTRRDREEKRAGESFISHVLLQSGWKFVLYLEYVSEGTILPTI